MLSDLELLNLSEENIKWFQENSSKIRQEFQNKIIAIKDKKIIASAQTNKGLLMALEQKGIDHSEVLIEAIRAMDEIIIL